ncbi:protoporphyrinogen oxidase, partial [Bacillus sp. S1-R5C1-FB]|uniref:protoporphyrinogen oxidase n=1 Tax=Bacillus sp. S1-R5C1-FB TaxID=1973491 RepID=UPI000B4944B2
WTLTHKKCPHTTPQGNTLLRCYVGRTGDEAVVEQTEEDLVQLVIEDSRRTMDITEDPEFTVVSSWKEAMPPYTVGHNERMKKLTTFMEKVLPGIYLAGSSYAGSGLPDCIDQGAKAAKRVLSHLEKVMNTE